MEKLKEFWDKLSSREKVALGVLVAGVVGYAFYKKSKNASANNTIPATGQPVDQYGNPLYPTNLSGVYSQQPGGSFSTGTTPTGTSSPAATNNPTPSAIGQGHGSFYNVYTVSPSESLNTVASDFGYTPQQLEALNPNLVNFSWTQAGAYAGHDVTVNKVLP